MFLTGWNRRIKIIVFDIIHTTFHWLFSGFGKIFDNLIVDNQFAMGNFRHMCFCINTGTGNISSWVLVK